MDAAGSNILPRLGDGALEAAERGELQWLRGEQVPPPRRGAAHPSARSAARPGRDRQPVADVAQPGTGHRGVDREHERLCSPRPGPLTKSWLAARSRHRYSWNHLRRREPGGEPLDRRRAHRRQRVGDPALRPPERRPLPSVCMRRVNPVGANITAAAGASRDRRGGVDPGYVLEDLRLRTRLGRRLPVTATGLSPQRRRRRCSRTPREVLAAGRAVAGPGWRRRWPVGVRSRSGASCAGGPTAAAPTSVAAESGNHSVPQSSPSWAPSGTARGWLHRSRRWAHQGLDRRPWPADACMEKPPQNLRFDCHRAAADVPQVPRTRALSQRLGRNPAGVCRSWRRCAAAKRRALRAHAVHQARDLLFECCNSAVAVPARACFRVLECRMLLGGAHAGSQSGHLDPYCGHHRIGVGVPDELQRVHRSTVDVDSSRLYPASLRARLPPQRTNPGARAKDRIHSVRGHRQLTHEERKITDRRSRASSDVNSMLS